MQDNVCSASVVAQLLLVGTVFGKPSATKFEALDPRDRTGVAGHICNPSYLALTDPVVW